MFKLAVVLVLGLVCAAHAKIYERCEFAQTLRSTYNFDEGTLGDWVCLVEHESSYNTAATNDNTNGSRDYGLFMFNSDFWCYTTDVEGGTEHNDCNMDCSSLLDDDITNDVACAQIVYARHGFDAWYGWQYSCEGQDTSSYISGCNI